jgi:glyoxylase-like metal-dependent hydrolase (beta-lactamase superfamily II)
MHTKSNFCILVCLLFFSSIFLHPGENGMTDRIKLYAIRYGNSRYYTKYIFYGNKENRTVDFDWLFYVLRINEKIILIDTGFNDPVISARFGINWADPAKLLEENLGIRPADVTDVIITHNHFDHIGCVDRFVNADLYMNRTDLDDYMNNGMKKITDFLKADKKLITFNEELILFDKITVRHIGGHSAGSCAVYLRFKDKKIIITGDECYLKENYLEKIPVGTYFNVSKNKAFINSLKDEDILTMHEPSIVGKGTDHRLIYEE